MTDYADFLRSKATVATVVKSGLKAALPHLRAFQEREPESTGSEQITVNLEDARRAVGALTEVATPYSEDQRWLAMLRINEAIAAAEEDRVREALDASSQSPVPDEQAKVTETPQEWLVKLAEEVIDGLYERPEECATEPEIARAIVAAVEQAIRNEERVKVLGEVRGKLGTLLGGLHMLRAEAGDRKYRHERKGGKGRADADIAAAKIAMYDDEIRRLEQVLATLDQEGPCKHETFISSAGFCCSCGAPVTTDCLDQEEEAPVAGCERCSGGFNYTYEAGGGRVPCDACHGTDKADCTQQVVEEGEATGEFLDDYKLSDLAAQVIERLEVRENEAAEKLEKWKAAHPGKHDSPAALVSYTEKRIYRDAILTVSDTDLERHVYRDQLPDPAPQGEEDFDKLTSVTDRQAEENNRLRRALRDVNAHIGVEPSDPTEVTIRAVVESALRLADEERATQNQSNDTVPSGGAQGDEETWTIYLCPTCGWRFGDADAFCLGGVFGPAAAHASVRVEPIKVVRRDSRLTKESVEKVAAELERMAKEAEVEAVEEMCGDCAEREKGRADAFHVAAAEIRGRFGDDR